MGNCCGGFEDSVPDYEAVQDAIKGSRELRDYQEALRRALEDIASDRKFKGVPSGKDADKIFEEAKERAVKDDPSLTLETVQEAIWENAVEPELLQTVYDTIDEHVTFSFAASAAKNKVAEEAAEMTDSAVESVVDEYLKDLVKEVFSSRGDRGRGSSRDRRSKRESSRSKSRRDSDEDDRRESRRKSDKKERKSRR